MFLELPLLFLLLLQACPLELDGSLLVLQVKTGFFVLLDVLLVVVYVDAAVLAPLFACHLLIKYIDQ